LLLIKVVFSNDNIMKEANTLFDQGKYIESVDVASQNSSIE